MPVLIRKLIKLSFVFTVLSLSWGGEVSFAANKGVEDDVEDIENFKIINIENKKYEKNNFEKDKIENFENVKSKVKIEENEKNFKIEITKIIEIKKNDISDVNKLIEKNNPEDLKKELSRLDSDKEITYSNILKMGELLSTMSGLQSLDFGKTDKGYYPAICKIIFNNRDTLEELNLYEIETLSKSIIEFKSEFSGRELNGKEELNCSNEVKSTISQISEFDFLPNILKNLKKLRKFSITNENYNPDYNFDTGIISVLSGLPDLEDLTLRNASTDLGGINLVLLICCFQTEKKWKNLKNLTIENEWKDRIKNQEKFESTFKSLSSALCDLEKFEMLTYFGVNIYDKSNISFSKQNVHKEKINKDILLLIGKCPIEISHDKIEEISRITIQPEIYVPKKEEIVKKEKDINDRFYEITFKDPNFDEN